MTEQGVKNTHLAAEIGVDKVTVSRWLNYHSNPSAENIQRIAEALNTTVGYLNGLRGAYKTKADQEAADADFVSMFGEELLADDPDEEARIKNRRQRRTVRNGFFLREAGYSYRENPAMDCSPIFCTLKDSQGSEYDFTHEEFQQLMTQIKDMVDFACFKNRNVVRDCGGIRPEEGNV